jgi:transcriptional regulator with XRE-family HTH domain
MNKRFAELRNKLNLSQKEFAEGLEMRQASISDIERGRTELNNKTILKLNEKYGVSIDWLYTGNGDVFIRNSDKNIRGDSPDTIRGTDKNFNNSGGEMDFDSWAKRHIELDKLAFDMIRVNKSDITAGYADILENIGTIRALLEYYNISDTLVRFIRENRQKGITRDAMMKVFKDKITVEEDLYEILKPYRQVIEEISNEVLKFNSSHDKYLSL